ncbi:MAG TPA: DUF3472 domain-containing protein [Candidatus Saccharimonadales bacterium]|nr:DUF3472 domain-containing protein [Candidatus Saccharimonadales bacterium]
MKQIVIVLLSLFAIGAMANEKLFGIACRSVHLGFPAAKGTAFYNEVRVEQSAPGSYFMVCGWRGGYFGMQELGNGKKVILFSVWDAHQGNDPKTVPEDQRVRMLHKDDKVRTGRFGGEGTGGQSFFDYDWRTNEVYRFLVTARTNSQRTEFSGYFYVPEEKAWKHLVTFSTVTNDKLLGGYYSFVEDFKRDKVSATRNRRAQFGNGWIRGVEGDWVPLGKARFTADSNPAKNIDAGENGLFYFLATGGTTTNATTKLNDTISASPVGPTRKPPQDLPSDTKAR